MKIYDRKAILMIILDFVIIAVLLWEGINLPREMYKCVIILCVCSALKTNIEAVFSEKCSKKRKTQVEKKKKAYKNAFGRFAPLAPVSFLIFLGIGLLLLKILKGSMLGIYVIIFGFFSPMIVDAIIRSEMHQLDTEQD